MAERVLLVGSTGRLLVSAIYITISRSCTSQRSAQLHPGIKWREPAPCGEEAVLCRERRLTATTDVAQSHPRQSSQSTLPKRK
jgi:hypothetical protein